ncbi:TonB-dependent receptor [Brumicola nitratireducens]|uniref:TonB-dependent receptor n=1 Tax=Glaciecola nitratireducens (strain JCM 12485 / KCTC 12276 / FR1064) TaxID=1085623 RepID=G4QLM8_GLANF|nr:TonB-dependent receptor [Glaciecola nitratireducens]AEP30134.1 TonB-dependent receptor [Glaciecola nitratireducens FR1064]
MTKFKPSLITVALVASGMMIGSLPLYAQQTPENSQEDQTEERAEENIEKIEVVGFRSSLIRSLNQKRFSDTVSEQISADDLGGLPDVSMADALTRLPGISAVRTGGQAAEINIRGLSGDFVFSTLNGREQVSTSGSRSIEFDQYPSELISSAAVYKSPKASLLEGGVAGTVELKTASPLDNDKQHSFNANVRGMYNDRANEVADADEFGHRLSFSYQGKFLEDTLGVALGYAKLYQPSVSTQFIGLAYNREKDVDFVENDIDKLGGDCPECEDISEGFEMQHAGGGETRNGYMAAFEWAPVDNFVLKADAFLSKFESEEFARGFRVKLEAPNVTIANPTLVGNDVIGGTFNRIPGANTRVELVNDDNQDFDEVRSLGINAKWDINEDWTVSFDVSHSSADSDFRNGLLWSLVAEDANALSPVLDENISISYLLNGLDLPDLGFNQASDFIDLNKVMVSKYGIYPFQNSDELDAYRIDFTYQLDNDWVRSIEFGARYSDRAYSNDRSVFEYGSDSGFSRSQPPLRLTEDMTTVVNWEGEFSYFPSYLAIDLDKALNAWFPGGVPQPVQSWGGFDGVLNPPDGATPNDTSWSVLQSGEVYEEVNSAYVMANLDMELAGIPVTGNIGVRMVDTKQASTFLQNVDGDPESGAQIIVDDIGLAVDTFRPVILEDTYTDYLPSLNLTFKLTSNQQVRFAAAKVMGRAPINEMFANSGTQINEPAAFQSIDTGEITVIGEARISGQSDNSPYLRPFYANQYDISYEYYFDDSDGAIIAALYYKDIQSFVDRSTRDPYDFAANGFVVPTSIDIPVFTDEEVAQPVLDELGEQVTITVPTVNGAYTTFENNARGGYIRGLELSYTEVYSDLPGMWSGLGVSASYSYTETEIIKTASANDGVYSTLLPGLSKQVLSGTVFWDYEGFETRVSARYRDPFVSKQVAVNDQVVNFDSELIIDYQASYEVNENLGILFQVNNLTDAPTKSYFGDEARTGTIQYFGTQFFLGLTYSL